MAKVLVAYVSMSGSTEEIAELLKGSVDESQHEITFEDLTMLEATDLENYEGLLIGSYTWGDGELPDEILDFYDAMDDIDLNGKKVAVFGSGDTAYPQFCEAVSILENKLKERGAEVVVEGLRVEFTPDTEEETERCKAFAQTFSQSL